MRSPLRARARVRVRPSLSLLRATTAPPAPTHAGPSTGSHPRRPLRRRPSLYLSLRARLPEQGGGDEGFAAPTPSAAATRPQLVAVPDRGGGGGEGGGGVSGSAMRGGGGRQPYAAPDGADAASIPAASRKMVQSLKGILDDRWEGEIYSTLCDCGMDPDIAIERLISQDTFHEVRRKRDKKKEKICFNSHVHRVVTGQDIGKLTLRNL